MDFLLRQTVPADSQALSQGYSSLKTRLDDLYEAKIDFSYLIPETFLAFIDDKESLSRINVAVEKVNSKGLPKTVFVVGIGGANLASKAIYDAIVGHADTSFDLERKMIFLDTLDTSVSESVMLHIKTLSSVDDFVVVIISKSGKTIETLANAEFLLSHLESKFKDIKDRIIVISKKDSPLFVDAFSKGLSCIEIPESLSDRFSAFSPTTLVPLACYGFLVDDLLIGARSMLEKTLSSKDNIALETAVSLDSHYKKGFHIYDLFFFSPRLETLGKWHRQLIAESLGKDHNASLESIHVGLTPTVSIGTTDLHSSLQLTLAGPDKKITAFVSVDEDQIEPMGDSKSLDLLSKDITSKSAEEVSAVILASVQESYAKESLPYFDIVLGGVNCRTLGAYMIFSLMQTVFLGALLGVNVFDQPNVEEYKNRARDMLN